MDLRTVNGISVWQQFDDRFTRNIISVNLITPLREQTAMTALLPGVLRCGCAAYPSLEALNLFLESRYGATFSAASLKKGESQIVRFSVSFLDDSLALDGDRVCEDVMHLLREMIFAPCLENGAFRAETVETEKKNLKDRIAARINDKLAYAMHRCVSVMCENEDYGLDEYGTPEEIDAVTPEALTVFYRTWLASATPFVYSCGRVDADVLDHFTRQLFPQERKLPCFAAKFVSAAETVRTVTEQMPVSQSQLLMGFRMGTASYRERAAALALLHTVYGSGTVSRLFVHVREKFSLCYYCSARMDRHKGLLIVFAGIRRENREKAQAEILAQLDDIRNGNVTEAELADGLREVRNQYREMLDDPARIEIFCLNAFLGGSEPEIGPILEALDRVAPTDIAEAAKRISLDTVYFLEGTGEGGDGDDGEV